jgi:hypothetical protein
MGGPGSGRTGGKFTVDKHCHVFSLAWLLQHGYLDQTDAGGGITWNNYFGDPIYTLRFWVRRERSTLKFRLFNTKQDVIARPTPLHFGGVRWWFDCPGCGRRCSKLYLPLRGEGFLCRLCHDLSYDSRNESRAGAMGTNITPQQMREYLKEKNWFRYPPWRRKRDRRPGYRDRGAWLREAVGDKILY